MEQQEKNEIRLELPEKVVSSASAHNFPYPRTVPLDCSQEWNCRKKCGR